MSRAGLAQCISVLESRAARANEAPLLGPFAIVSAKTYRSFRENVCLDRYSTTAADSFTVR
jgi:hypothetical protein